MMKSKAFFVIAALLITNLIYAQKSISTKTKQMITKNEVYEWLDAWNSHDMNKILDLFADSALVYQPQNPEPLTKDKVAFFFSNLFKTYPDIHFETDGYIIEGNEVASWEIVTGTMTGDFHDPATGKMVAPTGKSFKIPGAMRIIYDDTKKIASVRIYWDRLSFNQQLGLIK